MPDNYRHKVVVDPVHGDIGFSRLEQKLIDSPTFQRLRKLRQLGLASLVYPSACHTRFAHSLGVFRIMGRIIDLFVEKGQLDDEDRRKMRVAALLHDLGHYPYSHLMEYVDRDKHRPSYLGSPKRETAGQESTSPPVRYPDHEKIGQLAITERPDISKVLSSGGIDPEEIAKIIRGEHTRPAYSQLIHSSLDMDRMDYMVRDSLATGVPYGRVDLDYLLSNLDLTDDGEVVITHKAATAAEHFLVSRYFMHKTVYMHKTVFGFEAMLRHIIFLLRERKKIYRDGDAIEKMVLTEQFLDFHDGYIDAAVEKAAKAQNTPQGLRKLCESLIRRKPPHLVHEVSALVGQGANEPPEYSRFRSNRASRISELAKEFSIEKSLWIWEDPKDIKFESLSPVVSLSQAIPGEQETAELIRVRQRDGTIRPLVEDRTSILHHLSQLRLRMSRLYVVGVEDPQLLERIKEKARRWCSED